MVAKGKKLSNLPPGTSVAGTDYVYGSVGGVSVKIPLSLLGAQLPAVVEWIDPDITGEILVAGQAQTILGADPDRLVYRISTLLSAVDILYFALGVPAVVGVGVPIGPGVYFNSVYPPSANVKSYVSVISATAGVSYRLRRKGSL